MMQSLAAIAIVSVIWLLVGYTLAFGDDVGADRRPAASRPPGVGEAPHPLAPTVPHTAFAAFQLMFAVITPALIAGAFAERVRFGGYVAFVAAWSLLVYAPLAHWVWGGGFLGADGLGAWTSPAARSSTSAPARRPSRPPCTWAGAAGIRAGTSRRTTSRWCSSAPGSCGSAGSGSTPAARSARTGRASALLATHLGAVGAMIGWLVPERIRHGKATAVGAATGAVAGLVAITPAAGSWRRPAW